MRFPSKFLLPILLLSLPASLLAQDSLNINIDGRYYTRPIGYPNECKKQDDFLFLVTGRAPLTPDSPESFLTFSLDDPDHPVLTSQIPLSNNPRGLAVQGNYAYVAARDYGLIVVDISTPEAPVAVNELFLAGESWSVIVEGDIAYVASMHGGLHIIDVTTPPDPALIQTVHYDNEHVFPHDLALRDNFLHLAMFRGGLMVLDVSDPFNPIQRGSVEFPNQENQGRNDWIQYLTLDKTYAYIVNSTGGLITIVDTSDPDHLDVRGSAGPLYVSTEITLYNSYVLVADGGFFDSMAVFDVSDPDNPELIEEFYPDRLGPTYTHFRGIETHEQEYAYCSDYTSYSVGDDINYYRYGLTTLDISNPSEPVVTAYFAPWNGYSGVYYQDNHAYLISSGISVRVVDVTNHEFMLGIEEYTADSDLVSHAGREDYIYLATDEEEVVILDISTPGEINVVNTFPTTDMAVELECQGENKLLMLMDDSPEVRVYSLENPQAPVLQGQMIIDYPRCMAVHENLLAVGTRDIFAGVNALSLISLDNPENPVLIDEIQFNGEPISIDFNQTTVVIGTEQNIQFFDVQNPNDIRGPTVYPFETEPEILLLQGNILTVGNREFGIQMFDFTNPAQPLQIGAYKTVGEVNDFVFDERFCYVADADSGMMVLDCHEALGLPDRTELTIALRENYFNLISTPLVLPNLNAAEVFGDVVSLRIAMQEDGAIYYPPDINTIGEIDLTEAYRIFCQDESELTLAGEQIPAQTQYSLFADRFNWLGHPYLQPAPVTTALAPIVDELIIIYSDEGEIWVPGYFRSLENLVPGKGYYVVVSDDQTFNWQEVEEILQQGQMNEVTAFTPADNPRQEAQHLGVTPTGKPFAVLFEVDKKICSEIARIELWDDEQIVGATEQIPEADIVAVIAWQAYPQYNLPGFTKGDSIIIKAFQADGNMLPDVYISSIDNTTPGFGENAFALFLIQEDNPERTLPADFAVSEAYPNPFNAMVTVTVQLPESQKVRYSLLNVLGQTVYLDDVSYLQGGRKQYTINANSLPSGVYLLNIAAGNYKPYSQKIVLVK
ncbi:T9SS type A sorting domain-containing protein [bacterium]|nr:T9SS type A sorting domain-containing protein [bacterium]